jgi:zinc protease
VTPALIQKTAQEYLRSTNRSIYAIDPGAVPAAAPKPAGAK